MPSEKRKPAGFRVELEKESLIFSAAHFITFGENICEAIHGHNYRVAARVTGEVDSHACVIDFIWLRDRLQEITGKLDHHVLLPDNHPKINVAKHDREYEVHFEDRRWVFPERDVALLPVDNTTAERLAEYIGGTLIELIENEPTVQLTALSIGVDENEGQWGWCDWQF